MEFVLPQNIEDYAALSSTPEPEVLSDLQRETFLKVLHPRMLSGHVQGRFLSLLSKLASPKRILEIGTYTGYSALCMAEGLVPDGELVTIDCNDELAPIQTKYIALAGMEQKIKLMYGDALEILPTLTGPWDLVFIDADKANYLNYFQMVRDQISPGGLLIADNVLWTGKVLSPAAHNDIDTAALQAFSTALATDPIFETTMLTIRDGLTVARKKG